MRRPREQCGESPVRNPRVGNGAKVRELVGSWRYVRSINLACWDPK